MEEDDEEVDEDKDMSEGRVIGLADLSFSFSLMVNEKRSHREAMMITSNCTPRIIPTYDLEKMCIPKSLKSPLFSSIALTRAGNEMLAM